MLRNAASRVSFLARAAPVAARSVARPVVAPVCAWRSAVPAAHALQQRTFAADLIDGTDIAQKVTDEVAAAVRLMAPEFGRAPGLATVLVRWPPRAASACASPCCHGTHRAALCVTALLPAQLGNVCRVCVPVSFNRFPPFRLVCAKTLSDTCL